MSWEEKFLKRIEKTSNEYIDVKEIEIGRVTSVSPLQIMVGELDLYQKNLYINAELLSHAKSFTAVTGAPHSITGGSINFNSFLHSDDLVALRRMSDTKYLLLCKVVKGW